MNHKNKWKRRWPVIALILIMLTGVCVILYPIISNVLYEKDKSVISTEYDQKIAEMKEEEIAEMFAEADRYNESLLRAKIKLTDPFDPTLLEKQGSAPYMSLLNYQNDGVIGYLDIPIIRVNLPIYHGTAARTLEKGIGHLEQTSLPVGGESTHSVLTGHTGLAGKKMLTDLTEVETGDVFYIHVLDEILAYKVTSVSVVEPEDTSSLGIERGRDQVTLVTCYPYGVNSHRLLVTGERTSYPEAAEQEAAQKRETESVWTKEYIKGVLLCLAVYLPVIGVGIWMIRRRRGGSSS